MTTTLERKHPRLDLYFLKADFDGTFDQEAAWYERMAGNRAMSVRLNGRTVAGHLVTCMPFPLEKCFRLVFKPDERQPVEKAHAAHPSVLMSYPNLGRLALGRVPHREV